MNMRKSYLLALTMLGLFACTNDEESSIDQTAPKTIQLSISGAKLATSRASTSSAPSLPGAIVGDQTPGTINSVDVYITDASGIILRGLRVNSTEAGWTALTGAGLKILYVQPTAAQVYVFGNLGATALTAEGANISTVNVTKTLDQQQGTTNLLYTGMDNSITPSQPEPINPDPTGGMTYTAQVVLTPIVSRFQITGITFAAPGSDVITEMVNGVSTTATISWTTFSGQLTGVFLNNFYMSNTNRLPSDLMHNLNATSSIANGQWLFASTDLSAIASYSNYNVGTSTYQPLPLPLPANTCYAFNFFPENMTAPNIPELNLQLTNLTQTGLASTNQNVYNPDLFPAQNATAYVNVIGFTNAATNQPMKVTDFAANKLYNIQMLLKPYYLQGDLHHIQFNVLCLVTVQPWTVQNLIPNYDQQ